MSPWQRVVQAVSLPTLANNNNARVGHPHCGVLKKKQKRKGKRWGPGLNSAHDQYFSYDYLNRLTAGSQSDNSFNQTFSYDPWGNLSQSGTSGSGGTFNTNNQLSGSSVGSCAQSTGTFCFDAAGNVIWDTVHSYTFDAESRIVCVDLTSGTCGQSGAVSAATYTYDAEGNRVRKDVSSSDPTEYIYFGGVPIAEHDPTSGDWTDYIYANGNRIARADTFANRIHMSGTNSGAGQYTIATDTSLPTQLTHRQVQTGDKLYVAQYETGGYGGLQVGFTDGTYANSTTGFEDQNGQASENDENQNSWQTRVFAMDAYAGKYIGGISLISNSTSPADSWVMYFSNLSYTVPDGSVYPIYTGQSSFSANVGSSSGVSNVVFNVEHDTSQGAYPQYTTTYYHADHLGTSRLLTNAWGWPDWQGTFMPFGEEVNPQITTNHYLFTGDEHDTESNLEHTQFRQLSTVQGRWLSPDPAGMAAADLTNPQTLNMYAYVGNNPMNAMDPSGLFPCAPDDEFGLPCPFPGGPGAGGEGPPHTCDLYDDPTQCPFAQIPVVIAAGSGGGGGGSGSSGAPAPVNPSGKPLLSGETLGLPTGMSIQQRGLLAALGVPLPPDCDFGSCVPNLGVDGTNGSFRNTKGIIAKIQEYLLHRPWVVSWIVPLVGAPGVAGVGPAGSVAINPDTHVVCVGGGLGFSVGRNVSVGPLTHGVVKGADGPFPKGVDNVLAGGSVSGGWTPILGPGGQFVFNGSGGAFGPVVGSPGFSVASTFATCARLF